MSFETFSRRSNIIIVIIINACVIISWNIFSFQASGDHLPVAPPAPAHAQLAAQQAANYQPKSYDLGNAAEFDDGQYDPRYNDPSFEGNGRGVGVQASYVSQPSYAQQPIPQQQQYVQPQPQPQPQPQAYNPANNVNINTFRSINIIFIVFGDSETN